MPEEANDGEDNDSDFATSSDSSFDSDSSSLCDEFDIDAADNQEESSAIAPETTHNSPSLTGVQSTLPKLPVMQKSNKKTVVYSLSKHKMQQAPSAPVFQSQFKNPFTPVTLPINKQNFNSNLNGFEMMGGGIGGGGGTISTPNTKPTDASSEQNGGLPWTSTSVPAMTMPMSQSGAPQMPTFSELVT